MPGYEHELLVELFRNRPDLPRTLLELCAGIHLPGERVELGSIDHSQVMPATFLSDSVHLVVEANGQPTVGIIVEVQRDRDLDKRYSWPVYVAGLRAKIRAPVILLVLVDDPSISDWCREPIVLDVKGASLVTPVVISLSDIPRIDMISDAYRSGELAVLSALAHPELGLKFALASISTLSTQLKLVYSKVLLGAVQRSESNVQTIQEIKQYVAKLEQDARGKIVLSVARAKLGDLQPGLELRILEHADPESLVVALATAPDAEAARAVLVDRGLIDR